MPVAAADSLPRVGFWIKSAASGWFVFGALKKSEQAAAATSGPAVAAAIRSRRVLRVVMVRTPP